MSFDYDVDELDADDLSMGDDFDGDFAEEEVAEIDFDALGIDPSLPTEAKPGSEEKVLMLAARYATGVPLWHTADCYDHGPNSAAARLARKA